VRPVRTFGLLTIGAFGGFMAAAALAKRALPSRGDPESDELALTAIYDGTELKSRATAFRGGTALAWFGGIQLDLREAQLAPDAHLSVSTICGGIALVVSPGWRVESSVRAVNGGVNISGEDPDDADAPVLVLDGIAAFGGIAVGRKAAVPDAAEPAEATT
jgi:hypothetical protein